MWKTVKLGDVCKIKTGKKDVNEGNSSGQFPFFTCAKDHTYSDVYSFDCEAILIAGNGAVGQTSYYKGKFEAYQRTYVLTDFHTILPELLLFILKGTLMKHLSSMVLGNTIPYIKKGMIENFEFPLPPLAEQQRIVEKLDKAFEEIDRAIEATQENIANAKKLSAYAIDSAFGEYMAMSEELGKHSAINYGYTAKASFEKGLYKFLRITDIKNSGVDWENVPYCDVEDEKISKMLLHDGDIVFARTGATTGKSFLVENPSNAVFASYLIRVSLDRSVLVPRYVMHYFQSASYWLQVNEGTTGAAQGGFNASKLSELKIPIISKDKQEKLISKLDAMGNEIADYALTQNMKITHYENLKSAILAQELKGPES